MKRALTLFALRVMCLGRGLSKIQRGVLATAAITVLEYGEPPKVALALAWHSIKFLQMCNAQAASAMFTTTTGLGVDAEGNRQRRISYRQRAALRRYRK